MAEYLIQDTTMTAISDAVRGHTKKTAKLSPSQIASEIKNNLEAKEIILHADIPNYVKTEALRVANKVESVRQDDSIIFLAMSDNHYYGDQKNSDQYPSSDGIQNNTGNLHAAMAAKTLAYALDIDFMASLGDMTWGNALTTSDLLQSQSGELVSFLRESHKSIPCFHAIGNHDTGYYYHREQINDGKTGVYTEDGSWLYNNFTALTGDGTVFGGSSNGGYCYRDFTDKKLRVFLLNTSEALIVNQSDKATLGSQRKWFADALTNLNSKSDASSWKFIVLSHYPADYGNTMPLSDLIKAYVTGSSITIALESGSNATVNFSGKNSAKMVAQFHGHIHNFLTSKLYSNGTTYNAWRVATPNVQYNRENYYGIVNGVNFGEPSSYNKTTNTADDTSFVVNVINPSEQIIHSICYGAGRDRIIGYGSTEYYTVYANLSNVNISTTMTNNTIAVQSGQSFTATFTPNGNNTITECYAKMGNIECIGTPVISGGSASSTYTITIPSVTDNIYIYAKAERVLACRNWIPISTTSTGEIYNVVGYKANTRVHNGTDETGSWFAGIYSTGFIPIKNQDVIRFKNMTFSSDSNHRITFFNSSYQVIGLMAGNSPYLMDTTLKGQKDGDNYIQFTMNTSHANSKNAAYIRICCANISAESVVSINEEIKYLDEIESITMYSISLPSDPCIAYTNKEKTIKAGQSYTNKLTTYAGYQGIVVDSIIMNGIDITSSAYNSNTKTITISSVTGNIIINAYHSFAVGDYTNILPLSTDANGNYYGFKANTYLSDGVEGTRDDIYTTGFIPCQLGDKLYCRNVGMQTNNTNHRLVFYDANKTCIGIVATNATGYTGWHYGSDGNIDVLTLKNDASGGRNETTYIRLCCGYLGTDSIITVNEPIA